MHTVGKYWHTLRHLRPIQFYGRLWFRVARPRVDTRPAPPRRAVRADGWVVPAAHPVTLLGPDRMRFLDEEYTLAEHGWDDPALGKLWRYNLHYFEDLVAHDARSRHAWHEALLRRWVRENPPGTGTGWEPYPTSLRIVNWVKWALAGNTLPPECVESLAVQARWLARRLEIHLLGNHLFANAKALVFAGAFFEGPEAESWLELGLGILAREVREQLLADGGHFERTPMYHAIALEDMLDLCNVARAFPDALPPRRHAAVDDWRSRIPGMCRWLAAMTHPDGDIGFFNDAAFGITPAPDALFDYAARLGFTAPGEPSAGATVLQPSGYVRAQWSDAVALLDVAPIGPDYLPGHAHADTLAFELSLFGQRLLVNSGTSRYGADAERLRQRGTAAHNTVVVDDMDSSEVWGGFRVARRARPTGLSVQGTDPMVIECGHDGYRRLPGSPVHARTWTAADGALTVHDRVTGGFRRAQARYHLHPLVAIEHPADDGDGTSVQLRLPHGQRVTLAVSRGRLAIEDATWHPQFGHSIPTRCITVTLEDGAARTTLTWKEPA